MSFQKIPAGKRGNPAMRINPVTQFMITAMQRFHRFRGDRFMGMDLLYLTTVGAKSGQERQVTLSRFPTEKGWLIVASAGGAKVQPAWYHNIATHPDQVWAEVGGKSFRVRVEQLEGDRRADAWKRIKAEQPRYAGYEDKTDRLIPILELTPAT
ncbi:deazaflavin-dependent oxidoreductase (nitroreductase family) [Nocardia sp. GAS34]|uniref:nitroreductase family deazaflavin-dependent oxidoreductase n=1 Tax=unclassified Nocardia TaxID=2637762 RepID=UPI003D2071D9